MLEARVADDDRVTVRLVVREGKHRMVRRMLANVGAPVVGLRRERFGDALLGELAEGACEALADDAPGTYYMDDRDRPRASSPECSDTGALVDELGALGLNIR